MGKTLISMLAGILLLGSCSTLKPERSDRLKEEDVRQVRIVKEELDQIYNQFKSGELVYFIPQNTNGEKIFVNYETWKPEDNYYQPPWAMENGRTGSCKGFASLLADRLMKKDIQNVFIALGKVDLSNAHAWVEFHSKYHGEFMLWPTRGDMTEKSQVTNKYFQYHDSISPEQMKKLEEFRKRPGCRNLQFSYDLPRDKLRPFGILPNERKRRGLP